MEKQNGRAEPTTARTEKENVRPLRLRRASARAREALEAEKHALLEKQVAEFQSMLQSYSPPRIQSLKAVRPVEVTEERARESPAAIEMVMDEMEVDEL